MKDHLSIGIVILVAAGAVLGGLARALVEDGIKGLLHAFSRALASAAARRLPRSVRQRYHEEWRAEVDCALGGELGRLLFAVRLLLRARSTARGVAEQGSHPLRDTPEPGASMSNTEPGAVLAALAAGGSWIHRRVDRIELLDSRAFRRTLSVDFEVPQSVGPSRSGQVTLPLFAIPRQHRPRHVEMRDARGVATTVVSGGAPVEALLGVACNSVLAGEQPPSWLRPLLALVAAGEVRGEAVDSFLRDHGGRETDALRRDPTFRSLVRFFADNEVVFAEVPAVPGKRCVAKLSYEEDLPEHERRSSRLRVGRRDVMLAPTSTGGPHSHFEVTVAGSGFKLKDAELSEFGRAQLQTAHYYWRDGEERPAATIVVRSRLRTRARAVASRIAGTLSRERGRRPPGRR